MLSPFTCPHSCSDTLVYAAHVLGYNASAEILCFSQLKSTVVLIQLVMYYELSRHISGWWWNYPLYVPNPPLNKPMFHCCLLDKQLDYQKTATSKGLTWAQTLGTSTIFSVFLHVFLFFPGKHYHQHSRQCNFNHECCFVLRLSICHYPLRLLHKLQRWWAGNKLLSLFGEKSIGSAQRGE